MLVLQRLLPVLVAVTVLLWTTAASCADTNAPHFPNIKLSKLASAKQLLGDGWNGPIGFVVDDVNDLSHLEGTTKEIAEASLVQAKPMGVVAAATWNFRKQAITDAVSVRIFRFKDEAAADQWWQLRQAAKPATSQWEPAPELGAKAFRIQSKVLNQTATVERVLLGDTAVVVETMLPAETCREVMLHYVKQLAPPVKP